MPNPPCFSRFRRISVSLGSTATKATVKHCGGSQAESEGPQAPDSLSVISSLDSRTSTATLYRHQDFQFILSYSQDAEYVSFACLGHPSSVTKRQRSPKRGYVLL